MSTPDDVQNPEPAPTKDETLRRMERERAQLEHDIEHLRDDERAADDTPGLRRAAGDWRAADETGHNEEDEARG